MLSSKDGLGPVDIKQNLCKFATNPGWGAKKQGCGVATVGAMTAANLVTTYTWEGYPEATVSATIGDAAADLAARVAGPQVVSWQGASWQGASWQGSSWQGVPG